MCKVSIIVPSYNVGAYIDECLDSVSNQTLNEIEIICVDAGSSDDTLGIIRKHQKRDERIQLIISEKKSYGYQVNLGIDISRGEYLGIVESDDIVAPDMYEVLYEEAVKDRLDCVKSDYWIITGEKDNYVRERRFILGSRNICLYNKCIIDDYIKNFKGLVYTWSGIYRKDFIISNSIRHNESDGASYQDNGFWFQTMMHASRMKYIDKAFYCLRRDNFNSSYYSSDKLDAIHCEFDFIRRMILERKAESASKTNLLYLCNYFRLNCYIGHTRRILDADYGYFYNLLREDMIRDLTNHEIDLALYDNRHYTFLFMILFKKNVYRYADDDFIILYSEIVTKIMRCDDIYVWYEKDYMGKILAFLELFGYTNRFSGFILEENVCFDQIEVDSYKHVGKEALVIIPGNELRFPRMNMLKAVGVKNAITFD